MAAGLIEDDSVNEALFHKMKIGIDKNARKVCELMFAMPLSVGKGVPLAPWVRREFEEMRKAGSPSIAQWKDRDLENQFVTAYSADKPAKALFEIPDATITGIFLERDARTRMIHLYFSVRVGCGKQLWDWTWQALGGFIRLSLSPSQMEITVGKKGRAN